MSIQGDDNVGDNQGTPVPAGINMHHGGGEVTREQWGKSNGLTSGDMSSDDPQEL